MTTPEELRDRHLLDEIGLITSEYGALHRVTTRDLARCRADLHRSREVLGTVAHDLRGPLTTVLGFTELLLDDEGLSPAQRDLGERVDHAARAMTALAEELVEAVTVGTSPLASGPVGLDRLAARVVTRHQLLPHPRGVRVVLGAVGAGASATIVHGDEAKLERLLENLVSNALKFSPDLGVVGVSLTHGERVAEIRVHDDGPGVPPEDLERIFSPFHRTAGAVSVPGTGLGLTIVRQVAERHGGRVHAESVLGAGATFVARLPLADHPV